MFSPQTTQIIHDFKYAYGDLMPTAQNIELLTRVGLNIPELKVYWLLCVFSSMCG